MVEVLAWFAVDRTASAREPHWRRRARAAFARGGTGARTEFGGPGWGIAVRHRPAPWPGCAAGEGQLAVSLGLPVGLDATGGPLALARRLAAGADPAAEVVPPFAVIARDVDGTVRVAQDWLGMARLYTGARDGVLAFADRSTVLADLLGGTPVADPWTWAGVAASGHFGGDDAPVRGVRLLAPGTRITLRPPPPAAGAAPWRAAWRVGRTVDDLVLAGLAGRGGDPDRAAAALRAAAAASRAAADALRAAADPPAAAPPAPPGGPAPVGDLREATTRLLHRHDLHLPGADLLDPAAPPPPPVAAGGPRAPVSWYPADPDRCADRAAVVGALAARHLATVGDLAPQAAAARREHFADLLRHAAELGLAGTDVTDYVYLTERLRRGTAAPAAVHVALSPAAVVAAFAVPAGLARGRLRAAFADPDPPCRPRAAAVAAAARALLAEVGGRGLAGLLRPGAVAAPPRGGPVARRYVHLALADALLAAGRGSAPGPDRGPAHGTRDWAALDRDRAAAVPPAGPARAAGARPDGAPGGDRPPPGAPSGAPGRMDGQDGRR
ncbi:hypothetical protein [Pilimelia terevasa]|uniref:hypothetical protein n=1 Tax=Pilimelia terevasa TaxID=53372 RepID=UPI0016692FC2|nr:hypothetical protein [Pilimelia terevasa]